MILVAMLAAALACQQSPPPPKDPVIDWSPPNSETPAPMIPNAEAAKGNLGFVVKPEAAPIARQTGADFLRSQAAAAPSATPAPAAPQPSVADLFRERNAREAAERAAAERSAAVPDGTYRCRRTQTGLTCGTDEEAMRQSEEKAKALLDQMLSPD